MLAELFRLESGRSKNGLDQSAILGTDRFKFGDGRSSIKLLVRERYSNTTDLIPLRATTSQHLQCLLRALLGPK